MTMKILLIFLSNNFYSNDVDKSILKLTSQMKQNIISAKQDFDKCPQTNLSGKPKTSTHDSNTAKESQIKEILKESNDQSYYILMKNQKTIKKSFMKVYPPPLHHLLIKVLVHLQQIILYIQGISHLMKQMKTLFVG